MPQRNDTAIWSGLFRISAESGQTLQAQIRQAIVAAILDRQIAASMPLPSCRILAEKLGVARGTVVLAFQQLVDQGFLIARERRGHFVNPEVLATPAKPVQKTAELGDQDGLEGAPADRRKRHAAAGQAGQLDQVFLPVRLRPVRPGACFRPPNGANATAWRWRCSKSATGRPTWSTATTRC